jgi:hypothetical protein
MISLAGIDFEIPSYDRPISEWSRFKFLLGVDQAKQLATGAVLARSQSCRFLASSCRSLAVCTRTLAGFRGTLCPRAEWSQQSESANHSERRSRFRSRWNPGSVGLQDCRPGSNAGTTCNRDIGLTFARGTASGSGHSTGAELRRPVGITIAGGLLFSPWLTLHTTPVA